MDILSLLQYGVPLWVLILYYLLMAAINALPKPTEGNSPFYHWFFVFANIFAASLNRMAAARRTGTTGEMKAPQAN